MNFETAIKWEIGNSGVELAENEVHIWRINLNKASSLTQDLVLFLSDDEKKKRSSLSLKNYSNVILSAGTLFEYY
jgi:hypothetical protein